MISGNSGAVGIQAVFLNDLTIQGNRIGIGATGAALANGTGIFLGDTVDVRIGGPRRAVHGLAGVVQPPQLGPVVLTGGIGVAVGSSLEQHSRAQPERIAGDREASGFRSEMLGRVAHQPIERGAAPCTPYHSSSLPTLSRQRRSRPPPVGGLRFGESTRLCLKTAV